MQRTSVKFIQTAPFGALARIEGSAVCGDDAVLIELAMTESIRGPIKGVLKRSIPYSDLEEVKLRRRLFRKPVITFVAQRLDTFNSFPGARGYEYVVNPTNSFSDAQSFRSEVRLAIAQATTDRFAKQIEDSVG